MRKKFIRSRNKWDSQYSPMKWTIQQQVRDGQDVKNSATHFDQPLKSRMTAKTLHGYWHENSPDDKFLLCLIHIFFLKVNSSVRFSLSIFDGSEMNILMFNIK